MNWSTYGPEKTDASFRAVQRRVAALLPAARPIADGGASLEARQAPSEAPRLTACPVLEGHALRAVRVEGDPAAGFAAFLDGTQHSRVLCYYDGLPVVFGTVAAVVRVRHNRKLSTWRRGPQVERRLYVPCAYLPASACDALHDAGVDVVDTTAAAREDLRPSRHPAALLERALAFVKEDREFVEKHLAEEWCQREPGMLFVDGSTQESEAVATSPCAVGVIKSHRTLYVEGDALRAVFNLRARQRSSVFRVTTSRRTPVASWYLRLRDPDGHDPMWGLVRVEAADLSGRGERLEDLTARADRISRWVLAEAAPVALPDARWDKMAYPIRDCEEFLKAIS
jgi:hypothetical protein